MNNVLDIINESKDLEFNIKDDEKLVVNFYNVDLHDINIKIKQENNSEFILNFVGLINDDTKVNIDGLISGSNNKNFINVRTIAEKGISTFNVNVHVLDNTKDNEVVEDLKGINTLGGVTLMPILEIDTNEVNASHFATVGGFDKNQIFYLLSKGITEDDAYLMLRRAFLHSIFKEDFIKKIERM